MPPEDRIRIEHMIDAAGSVARLIADRLKNDIETDEMLRFALVRAIEIFGEAASKVSVETRILIRIFHGNRLSICVCGGINGLNIWCLWSWSKPEVFSAENKCLQCCNGTMLN